MCAVCGRTRGPANTVYFKRARARYFPDTTNGTDSDGRDFGTAVNGPECQVGWRSGCFLDAAAAWGTLGKILDSLASRGPKERNRQLHNSYTGSGLRLRVRPVTTARCRLAIGPPTGSSIRVFYRTGVLCARRRARNKCAPRNRQIRRRRGGEFVFVFRQPF